LAALYDLRAPAGYNHAHHKLEGAKGFTMLHFEGDRDVVLPPAELSAKLSDARFLVESIPGAETVTLAESNRAVCTLRPGFSFVRGTLELTVNIIEAVAAISTRLTLHSKGIGTTSEVEVLLSFAAVDDGTRVHWTADIKQLGGLLKAVPQGLIRGAAQKVIDDVWTNVNAKVR
jgi:carbon monoxide dehydrogenase subunit G